VCLFQFTMDQDLTLFEGTATAHDGIGLRLPVHFVIAGAANTWQESGVCSHMQWRWRRVCGGGGEMELPAQRSLALRHRQTILFWVPPQKRTALCKAPLLNRADCTISMHYYAHSMCQPARRMCQFMLHAQMQFTSGCAAWYHVCSALCQ
jgi:hypothetical protein